MGRLSSSACNWCKSDPSGYSGDGGLSGEMEISESGQILSFGSDLTGWMVGEKHLNANQAKLRLLEVPNNKIVDFRSGLFPEPLDEALGLGTATKVFNLNTDVTNTLENFVSPFQKEKRKILSEIQIRSTRNYIFVEIHRTMHAVFSL